MSAKTKLSAAMKKSIMQAIFKSAILKAVDRDAIRAAIRNELQAFYQELYGHGELHQSWQVLHKAGLAKSLTHISLDDAFVGGNDSFRYMHQSFGSSDWRFLGERLGVLWSDCNIQSLSVNLEADDLKFPSNLMADVCIRLQTSENLARIAAQFRAEVFERFSKAPASFDALRSVHEVVKSTNNVEALVEKLPEIKSLILEVVSKHQPSTLPSKVNAEQVRNFLADLAPIEVKVA